MFRSARRTAFTLFMRFFTDGFVKYARRLNSFNTPERSYFFLKRLMARSMGSFSETMMPTRLGHLPSGDGYAVGGQVTSLCSVVAGREALEETPFTELFERNNNGVGAA
jgi:hypothetical protein